MQTRSCFNVSLTVSALVAATLGMSVPMASAQEKSSSAPASKPETGPGPRYTPITKGERLGWIVDGTIGPKSLAIGVLAGGWDTAFNTPEEWGRSWSGFAKRYVQREADVAISSSLEAGLGAIWGEDPRYFQSRQKGIWPRTRYAMKTVFLAPRRDGRLAPAWGRVAGNVFNNVIENSWLPPSVTTGQQTALRSAEGFVGRLIGNLWSEFWPDVSRHVKFGEHFHSDHPIIQIRPSDFPVATSLLRESGIVLPTNGSTIPTHILNAK